MGFRNALDLFNRAQQLDLNDPALTRSSNARQAVNTWVTGGDLQTIAWSDLFNTIPRGWATRAEAMRVPAIVKARSVLMALIAPRPLVVLDGTTGKLPPDRQPSWLYRTDGLLAPQMRTMQMLDDLIFHEATLLAVRRGAIPAGQTRGPILDAVHVPRDRWAVDPDDGVILVDDDEAPADSVVWIPGPWGGLLREGGDVIQGSRDLTRAWTQRARQPLPGLILQETDQNNMTDAEVDVMLERVSEARRSPDGAVMYLPQGITATPIAANDDAALFENGRNALRLDVANFMAMPAAQLDGSPNTASLNYDTRQSQRLDLQDFTLAYWVMPIESRLSLDDVVPRGQRVRFDFTDLDAPTNTPTGAPTED